jgi:hypothetical protein
MSAALEHVLGEARATEHGSPLWEAATSASSAGVTSNASAAPVSTKAIA